MEDTRMARQALLRYLQAETRRGPRYFKAKRIGEVLGLSSKEVGSLLSMLSHGCEDLRVEKWSHSNSATWRVEPRASPLQWTPLPDPLTEP